MTINQGHLDNLKKSPYSIEWWDSKWELEYMKELESDKEDGAITIKWTKNHGILINYFTENKKLPENLNKNIVNNNFLEVFNSYENSENVYTLFSDGILLNKNIVVK